MAVRNIFAIMKIMPSIPKGTRDFSAKELFKRRFVMDTIKRVYELFGFEPIETPTMEKLQILTGKYGEEGDQLLFKVLNSGDFLKKASEKNLSERNSAKITSEISEKGLRYDLTVPFARYVVQHRNDITFPFKRYQMQPVWRADRPQKGRYREFYQLDADVIGTESLLIESEFLQVYDHVFRNLGIKSAIVKINNRKILAGIAEVVNANDQFMSMTIAIDKLDKIGINGVADELTRRNFNTEQVEQIKKVLGFAEQPNQLELIEEFLKDSETGLKGVKEIKTILNNLAGTTVNLNNIEIDITLARGLTYYTGTIFEAKVAESGIGSISGGGRYDDLTSVFGLKEVSGVGISFGLDRIVDVMDILDLWPEHISNRRTTTRVLVTYMNEDLKPKLVDFMEKLRFNEVNAELYPEPAKMKKQLKYANDKGIPFVVVIGEEEVEKGEYQLKFMESGRQQMMAPAYIINALRPKHRKG